MVGATTQAPQTVAAVCQVTAYVNPTQPNLTDFLTFLAIDVQIPAAALPGTSPYPGYALKRAQRLVLQGGGDPEMYVNAVYCCATHLILATTPDQVGQTYFAQQQSRAGYGTIVPSTGLVVASSDVSTSSTLAEPVWASRLTVGQLDFFKTPWGRVYLSYNQSYGPSIWGLT
jgi:hypothetical protein